MTIKPVLGDWEIPRIASIRTLERRTYTEFSIPGRTGSLYQDLNSAPTAILIQGSLYGEEVRNTFFQELRGRFQAGEAVTFVADILTATELQYVVIETLHLEELGERPDQLGYTLILRESPPPPPPTNLLGELDTDLLDQADDFLDAATGALDALDALGDLPQFQDPTPPLSSALDGVKSVVDGLAGAGTAIDELFGSGE